MLEVLRSYGSGYNPGTRMVTPGLKRLCGGRDGGLFNKHYHWDLIPKKQLPDIFFDETWMSS